MPTRASRRREASTDYISWDLMRLIFLREGKVAARGWPLTTDETPELVRQHLLRLLSALATPLNGLDEDLRDSLMSVFFASAKRARTADSGPHYAATDSESAAINERIRIEVAQHGGAEHWEINEDARRAAEHIAAHPDSPVSQQDVAALYREIGRLCGPLLLSEDPEGFPDLPDIATNALRRVIDERVMIDPVFNELTHELERPSIASVHEAWTGELLKEIRASRQRYYYGRDPLAPLPAEPTARAAEIERRAAQRTQLRGKAESAIDLLVRPVLTSYAQYLETLVKIETAAAAERERAERELREAAGWARPEPQKYGVSPRGAELWVADALRWLGLHDAEVTQQSADGGVDVLSARYAVSVKHYAGSVPVEEIREIFGVAVASGRIPLLWTSGTLTASALQFAELAPVAVIQYDVASATWTPLNDSGVAFLTEF